MPMHDIFDDAENEKEKEKKKKKSKKQKESKYTFTWLCWGPKFYTIAHSVKSKEKPWALTKEDPIHEVKKNHEGPKSQKEGKRKK